MGQSTQARELRQPHRLEVEAETWLSFEELKTTQRPF